MATENKKTGSAKLNDEVAKSYTTSLKGWANQKFKCVFTGTVFTLEEVSLPQVEAMVKRGSPDFAKKSAEPVAKPK